MWLASQLQPGTARLLGASALLSTHSPRYRALGGPGCLEEARRGVPPSGPAPLSLSPWRARSGTWWLGSLALLWQVFAALQRRPWAFWFQNDALLLPRKRHVAVSEPVSPLERWLLYFVQDGARSGSV